MTRIIPAVPEIPTTTIGTQMWQQRSATLPQLHSGWIAYSGEKSPEIPVSAIRISASRNPGMHIPRNPSTEMM